MDLMNKEIVDIYYNLEQYDEVIKSIEELEIKDLLGIHDALIMSLLKRLELLIIYLALFLVDVVKSKSDFLGDVILVQDQLTNILRDLKH